MDNLEVLIQLHDRTRNAKPLCVVDFALYAPLTAGAPRAVSATTPSDVAYRVSTCTMMTVDILHVKPEREDCERIDVLLPADLPVGQVLQLKIVCDRPLTVSTDGDAARVVVFRSDAAGFVNLMFFNDKYYAECVPSCGGVSK